MRTALRATPAAATAAAPRPASTPAGLASEVVMFPPRRFVRNPLAGLCAAALGLAVVPQPGKTVLAADPDAEARSILAANCVKCHGPTKQKGGLRFDTRDGLLAKGDSGSPAVTPGKPAA